MQSYKELPFDARPFEQICAPLYGTYEYYELRSALVAELKCTPRSVDNWATGRNRPLNYATKKLIEIVVSKQLGIKCDYKTLFPL